MSNVKRGTKTAFWGTGKSIMFWIGAFFSGVGISGFFRADGTSIGVAVIITFVGICTLVGALNISNKTRIEY